MSQPAPASCPVVIALATAWGPKFGGINAFNEDFIKSLGIFPGRAFRLLCLVQAISDAEQADVRHRFQIELLPYSINADNDLAGAATQCVKVLQQANLAADALLIFIGHDDKTGPLALALKELFSGSKVALIHHMAHGAYQSYKKSSSLSAREKSEHQMDLFGKADVCLAVGPMLKAQLHGSLNTYPKRPEVHMLVPGLSDPTAFEVGLPDQPSHSFTAFVAGRLSAEDDRIKQGWLALRGFGRAVRDTQSEHHALNALRQSPRLRMRGVTADEEPALAGALVDSAEREIARDFTDYTDDRRAYFQGMASASVVLMPSWHEGFGLVAWEAIACELPVLIGEQSGVYRLLKNELAGAGLGSDQSVFVVNVNGNTPDNNGEFNHTEQDVDNVARHLVALGANIGRAKTQAQKLRRQVLLQYDWKRCAGDFAEAVSNTLCVTLHSAAVPAPQPSPALAETVLPPASVRIPVWLRLPAAQAWQPELGLSPSKLLMARDEVVPFDPVRLPEINRLMAWADGSRAMDIQLVTGAGGLGKTRLAYEMARQLQKTNAWHSLWLGSELPETWASEWRQLCHRTDKPLLLVIDYAEARQAVLLGLLQQVLERLAESAGAVPARKVRILLLARSSLWWQSLRQSAHCSETVAGWLLENVGGAQWGLPEWNAQMETRRESYLAAMRAYARVQGVAESPYVPKLGDAVFARPLYLHMAALAALDGQRPETEASLLEVQLHHEWRYWFGFLGDSKVEYDDWADAMAWLALRQGAHPKDLAQALAALGVESAGLGKGLQKFYAAAGGVAGLQPDLLAEFLLRQRLGQARGVEILALALPQGAGPQVLGKVLEVIGRLSVDKGAVLEFAALPVWRQVLAKGLANAWPALGTALVVAAHMAEAGLGALLCHAWVQLPAQQQKTLAQELDFPYYSSNLLQLKPLVRRSVLQAAGTPAKRAAALNNLVVALAQMGGTAARAEALECARESVKVYRELAQTQPAAYLLDVAMSLNNLANLLYEQGEAAARAEALECARESLQIRRELAQTQPAAYLPYVAGALNNLAISLSEQGDAAALAQALEYARESVKVYRELAQTQPAAYLPYVATALNNLANRLSEQGGVAARAEALECARESLLIWRELAQTQPAAYLPDVARSLNTLASSLSEQGDAAARAEALECAREAVTLNAILHQQMPAAFEKNFIISIQTFAQIATESGLDAQAELHALVPSWNPPDS